MNALPMAGERRCSRLRSDTEDGVGMVTSNLEPMAGIGPTLTCSRSFLGSIFAGVYRRFFSVRQFQVIAYLTLSQCSRTEAFAEGHV